jgi:hypothetical protein
MSNEEEVHILQWTSFRHGSQTYDLTHLHARTVQFVNPAKDGKAAITFTVDVTFSLHCFSRSLPAVGSYDRTLEYSDARETRLFDVARYELSKHLPGIVKRLTERKCQHTGKGNFFTVEIVAEDGATVNYAIFFTASKSSRKGRLNVYVQSAYVKERSKLPAGKPIRFLIVLYNTLNSIPIRD